MAQNALAVALKYPSQATGSQFDLSDSGPQPNPRAQGFATLAASPLVWNKCTYRQPAPWPLPCSLQLLSVDSLPGDWAMLSICTCEQFAKTDQTEGVMECHKVPLHSCVMGTPAARVTPTCLPWSYVSWSQPALLADFKTALVLDFRVYESNEKIPHVVSSSSSLLMKSFLYQQKKGRIRF